ncbi:MAG: hypothetical protein JWL73_1163 [Actinomycetia bacterium]|nr:hypothetical protein [Actinomycetes bacterium]
MIRRALALVVGLALAACASGGADAGAKPPTNDPAAATALEHRMEQSAGTPWFVRSSFHRRLRDGRTLRDAVAELNLPPATHLNVASGSLSGTLRGTAVECSSAAGTPTCSPAATADAPDAGAAAIRTVTDPRLGWYTVRRAASRSVLGRSAACFRVAVTPKAGRLDFGQRTDLCFLANGVPVRKVVVRKSGTDTTTATSVQETATEADVNALVAPFR